MADDHGAPPPIPAHVTNLQNNINATLVMAHTLGGPELLSQLAQAYIATTISALEVLQGRARARILLEAMLNVLDGRDKPAATSTPTQRAQRFKVVGGTDPAKPAAEG